MHLCVFANVALSKFLGHDPNLPPSFVRSHSRTKRSAVCAVPWATAADLVTFGLPNRQSLTRLPKLRFSSSVHVSSRGASAASVLAWPGRCPADVSALQLTTGRSVRRRLQPSSLPSWPRALRFCLRDDDSLLDGVHRAALPARPPSSALTSLGSNRLWEDANKASLELLHALNRR